MNKETEKTVFEKLYKINVNDQIEKKNGLSYLSWSSAWAEVKKLFPTANYTVYEAENGCIYHTDGKTCWVKTGAIIDGLEHIEYLPVMDFRNKSIPCANVTSVDVNKAIQRSITKAFARHGLGLYIYEGEDFPEEEAITVAPAPKPPKATPNKTVPKAKKEDVEKAIITMNEKYSEKIDQLINNICATYQVMSLFELTDKQLKEVESKL